jgi:dTDP-glucose pyrophosphorylase
MKGLILAGGESNSLYHSGGTVSKQQLPVYDKPKVYYPSYALLIVCRGANPVNSVSGLVQKQLGKISRFRNRIEVPSQQMFRSLEPCQSSGVIE